MNERLEEKLRRLAREDLVDWAGERTVQRGEGYLGRVGDIVSFDDCIAANVRGTEEYTTNVYTELFRLQSKGGATILSHVRSLPFQTTLPFWRTLMFESVVVM